MPTIDEIKAKRRELGKKIREYEKAAAGITPKPPDPATLTLAEIEANHNHALVIATIEKMRRGEMPLPQEKKAYQEWLEPQVEKAVKKWIHAVTPGEYKSWVHPIPPQTIYQHHEMYGIPCKGKKLDIPAIICAFHNFMVDKWRILRASEDAEEVEDSAMQRKRAADADMAEDERDKRRGYLVPASQVHSSHVQWANRLRKASEQLGRKFGAMAQRILDDALADCEKHVANLLDEK